MNFRESSEQPIPRTYEELVQIEMNKVEGMELREARNKVELTLFNERIGQFVESDLVEDEGGGWEGFNQKVRDVFPEIPEERFRAMKAAVTMELCGQ